MPQSLIQTPADAGQALEVGGRSLVGAHAQIASILKSRLGQDHGELLAQARPLPDGATAWSTSLEGTVRPLASLAPAERARLQQRAERLMGDIRGLAVQMSAESPAARLVAQMLQRALMQAPGDWLYSVGGKPVLVMWGHAAPGAAPPLAPVPMPVAAPAASPPAAPVAPAGAAAVEQLAASMAGPTPPEPPPPAATHEPSRRWLGWGLPGLLLLALVPIGLSRCGPSADELASLIAQTAEAEARNRALEDELRRKRAATLMCMADAPVPEPPAPAEPAASTSAPPPPSPLEALRKRVADAGDRCDALVDLLKRDALLKSGDADAVRKEVVDTLNQRCKDTLVREARNLCPGERPAQLVPEFVIVFDASPSMAYSLNASRAQIEWAERMRQPELMIGDPQRVKPAREAAIEVARRVPRDMSTGLVLVDSCDAGARPVGFFGPSRRAALIAQLQGIQPHPFRTGSGTPLADGLARAGQMVDGVKREATILVISDGEESCRGDPCATARALAAAKPRLKINVLDITGTGAGNCVAAATKGHVFTARNAADVVSSMRRAAQEVMGPANCRS